MSSVLDIAKKINKAWKEDTLTNIIPEAKRISLGSMGLDYAFYGGIPLKMITVFSGVEHSGKTVGACLAMAQYQKQYPNNVCIYVDAEQTLIGQMDFLKRMTGLDTSEERFLRYECSGKTAEEIFQDIIQLLQADNIGMIVIDSAPALVSSADLDNDFTKDNGMRASVSKSIGKFMKMMVNYLAKRDNALLIINQVRDGGKTYNGILIYTEPGGYALKYYPSLKVRFGSRTFTQGDKTDCPKGDDADGFRLKCLITKNRLGPTNRGGGYATFRYATGADVVHDTLEVAMKYGFVEHPNNLVYILTDLDNDNAPYLDSEGNELRFKGKQAVIDYLNRYPEFKDMYFKMLYRHISNSTVGINLLDDADLRAIQAEEDAVNNNITAEERAEKAVLEAEN